MESGNRRYDYFQNYKLPDFANSPEFEYLQYDTSPNNLFQDSVSSESNEYEFTQNEIGHYQTHQPIDEELSEILNESQSGPSNLHSLLRQSINLTEELNSMRDYQVEPQHSPNFPQPMPQSEVKSIGIQVELSANIYKSVCENPAWDKINTMLRQHGFGTVPVNYDDLGNSVPNIELLASSLVDLFCEYDKRGVKIQQKDGDFGLNERVLQQINRFKSENEQYSSEIKRLQQQLEVEVSKNKENHQVVSAQIKDMDKSNRILRQKLGNSEQLCKQRENTINELRQKLQQRQDPIQDLIKTVGPEREKQVFRRFFNREYRATNAHDSKVMNLISYYESLKKKIQAEYQEPSTEDSRSSDSYVQAMQSLEKKYSDAVIYIDRLSREKQMLDGQKRALQEQIAQLQSELNERPTVRELKNLQETITTFQQKPQRAPSGPFSHLSGEQCRDALDIISKTIGVSSIENIIASVRKMQQVVKAIPSLEGFISGVCKEVMGNINPEMMDGVIPTIRKWKYQIEYLDDLSKLRAQICTVIGIDPSPQTPSYEIIHRVQSGQGKGSDNEMSHFHSLFNVQPGMDTMQVMNQVYIFVNEMKQFLQYIRSSKGLDPRTPVTALLDYIKHAIKQG